MFANILDPNETFTQDHFTNFVLSDSKNHVQAKSTGRSGRACGQFILSQRAESG
jgi:hypothetical protein